MANETDLLRKLKRIQTSFVFVRSFIKNRLGDTDKELKLINSKMIEQIHKNVMPAFFAYTEAKKDKKIMKLFEFIFALLNLCFCLQNQVMGTKKQK